MGDQCMSDSMIAYIEKDIFESIDNEDIMQSFQNIKTRRGGFNEHLCRNTTHIRRIARLQIWEFEEIELQLIVNLRMCIAVFVWQDHPIYPFLLLLNRDEYHTRPTNPLAWWEGGGHILGGRDGLAGGTWLACTRDGRVAFLTNVREIQSLPQPKSRGHLPVRFLESKKDPHEFAEELVKEADQYNGFNLIIADLCSMTMVYVTNRPKEDNIFIMEVSPGIHVLSNARLDSPWPKSERLRHSFKELLDLYGDDEVAVAEMVEKLMRDTVRDEESVLPHIYPVEKEYYLSSIFVEAETPLGRYGTRSSSALSFTRSGELSFYERSLQNCWEEQTVTYQIAKPLT